MWPCSVQLVITNDQLPDDKLHQPAVRALPVIPGDDDNVLMQYTVKHELSGTTQGAIGADDTRRGGARRTKDACHHNVAGVCSLHGPGSNQ